MIGPAWFWKRTSRPPRRRPAARRFAVESLETRRLLAIVHVNAATGNDATGDGSAAAPFQTIGKGVTEAVANDELQIAAGDYTEAVTVNKNLILAATGAVNADSWATVAANTVTWDGTFSADTDFTFNGPTLLRAATQYSGANVQFLGTLNSALAASPQALTVNATTLARFGDAAADTVGVTAALSALSVGAAGETNIGAAQINTNGSTITFNNPVVLNNDLVVTELGAGDVSFLDTVDSDSAVTPRSLTVNTPAGGDTIFVGAVGATFALNNLTTNATGDTRISAPSVITSGDQTYNDPVLLEAAATTFQGANVRFLSTLQSTAATNTTINTVAGGGQTRFVGAVGGGGNPLGALDTDVDGTTSIEGGAVFSTGTQQFRDAVTVTTTAFNAGAGDVRFDNTLNASAANQDITVNSTGVTRFGGLVGNVVRPRNLTTTAGGQTILAASPILTTGDQTYNDAVLLEVDVVVESATGGIFFNSTVDSLAAARSLTVDTPGAGDTLFAGAVGLANALSALTTNAPGITRIAGSNVITTGDQAYNDPVRLEGAATTFAGANVRFFDTLQSNAGTAATINSAGQTRFVGAVGGGGNPLGSLETNPGGTTSIEGAAVTTTGAQLYRDAVTITQTTTFTGGSVEFFSTLNASAANQDVLVNATGDTRFGGNVGNVVPPRDLTTNAGGRTLLGAATILTTRDQTYNDRIVLIGDATTQSQTGNVVFNAAVDAANNGVAGTSDFGLTVIRQQGNVDVVFNAAVGANGSGVDDPDGVQFVIVDVNGPLRLIVNMTATELIRALVREGAAASVTDDLTVQVPVVLSSLQDIELLAGDDITIDPGATAIATNGTLNISGDVGDNDTAGATINILGVTGTVGAGTQVLINGGGGDDFLNLQFARFRAGDDIVITGGGNSGATFTLFTETVAFANPCNATVVTGTSTLVPVGDALNLFDTGQAANQVYNLNSAQIARSGGPAFQFAQIQQLDLLAGTGADQLIAQMPGLPSVVQFDGGGNPAGTSDQLDVIGSAGNDLISVGPISAVPPHRPFEVANVEALRVQAGDGNDTVVNNTPATALLEGQGGDDILIGGPQADVIYGGFGVDDLYGLNGGDYLFPDHDFNGTVDGVLTIADGDFSAGGQPVVFPGDAAIPLNNPGVPIANLDTVCSIERLIDGGATKDVLTWLNAQLLPVSSAAIRALIGDSLDLLNSVPVNTLPPLQLATDPGLVENPDFNHWLDNLYQALLGRDASDAELQYYINAHAAGASRDDIVQGFLNSPERRGNLVNDWYNRYLGRSLDAGGRAYWLNVWANSGAEAVESGILGSGEFFQRVGGANGAWVDAMYTQVLGRTAGPTEKQFWVDKANLSERQLLSQLFVNSDEHRLLGIASWYRNYLSRDPELGGSQFWLQKQKSGLKPEKIQSSILTSLEFQKMVW